MKFYILLLIFIISCTTVVLAQDDNDEKNNNPCFQEWKEKLELIEKAELELFRVRRINFSGNVTTRDREMRKMMKLQEGDISTFEKLEESIESLGESKDIYPISLENVKVKISKKYRGIYMTFCIEERPK